MNINFVVVDNLNSVAFDCYSLVKFNFNNYNYLLYYLLDNNSKCNVFVSKLLQDSNGMYYISDISDAEKEKLEPVSKNIFAILPNSYSKGIDINKFINDFSFENNIIFSKEIPALNEQGLCSNSNLANSYLEYCNFVRSFYDTILPNVIISPSISSSVWNIPSSDVNETVSLNDYKLLNGNGDVDIKTENQSLDLKDNNSIIPGVSVSNTSFDNSSTTSNSVIDNYKIMNPLDFQPSNNTTLGNNYTSYNGYSNTSNTNDNSNFGNVFSKDFNVPYQYNNYQDSSSGGGNQVIQSNKTKVLKKNAGFASNGYVIIGSICLILSAIIVAIAIILVKNL